MWNWGDRKKHDAEPSTCIAILILASTKRHRPLIFRKKPHPQRAQLKRTHYDKILLISLASYTVNALMHEIINLTTSSINEKCFNLICKKKTKKKCQQLISICPPKKHFSVTPARRQKCSSGFFFSITTTNKVIWPNHLAPSWNVSADKNSS